jgi:HK97 family phage portal protein
MKILGYDLSLTKRDNPAANVSPKPVGEQRSGGVPPRLPISFGRQVGSNGGIRASITTPKGTNSVLAISAVYACVRILADQMASLPLNLKKEQSEGYFQPYRNHFAYRMMRRPNNYQSGFDFRRALFASAYLFGNGIAYIKRDGAARPIEAHVVPTANVAIGDYDGQLYYIITPVTPSGQLMERIVLPSSDVIHIKALNLDSTGVDIISAHAGTFGLAQAAQTYANQYFTNGASFSGVVEHPLQLGDTGMTNIRTSISEQQTSTGSVLVLEEGAKYNKLNDNMKDSGVVEMRRYSVSDIARLYGVPLYLLGENSGTTFSNMEQMNRAFCQTALVPMAEQAEAQFDLVLLSQRDFNSEMLYFEHDFGNLLRGDMKTQSEIMRFMLTNGVVRRNEVRDWQNLARDPNLNDYLTPLNMTTGDNTGSDDDITTEPDPEPTEGAKA